MSVPSWTAHTPSAATRSHLHPRPRSRTRRARCPGPCHQASYEPVSTTTVTVTTPGRHHSPRAPTGSTVIVPIRRSSSTLTRILAVQPRSWSAPATSTAVTRRSTWPRSPRARHFMTTWTTPTTILLYALSLADPCSRARTSPVRPMRAVTPYTSMLRARRRSTSAAPPRHLTAPGPPSSLPPSRPAFPLAVITGTSQSTNLPVTFRPESTAPSSFQR